MSQDNFIEMNSEFLVYADLSQEFIDFLRANAASSIGKIFLKADIQTLSLLINRDNVNDIFLIVPSKTTLSVHNFVLETKTTPEIQDRLLPFSIKHERSDLVDFLLSLGADPNCCSNYCKKNSFIIQHKTCLVLACARRNRDIVEKLLLAGADPNLVPEHHITKNNISFSQGSPLENYSAVHPICSALSNGNYEYVDLLMAYGADINFENGNMYATPFYGMIRFHNNNNDLKLFKQFIDKGVIVDKLIHPYIAYCVEMYSGIDKLSDFFQLLLGYNMNFSLNIIRYNSHLISPATDPKFFLDGQLGELLRFGKSHGPLDCISFDIEAFEFLIDNGVPIIPTSLSRSYLEILSENNDENLRRKFMVLMENVVCKSTKTFRF